MRIAYFSESERLERRVEEKVEGRRGSEKVYMKRFFVVDEFVH